MNFESFAEQHGLIIDHLVYDRWARVPTTDKPNKKNGAYIYDGVTGAVRNWAVHEKAIAFLPNGKARVSNEKIKKSIEDSKAKQKLKNNQAIKNAKDMLDNAVKQTHPYMIKKGFHDCKVPVYKDLILLPMRIGQNLVGCQTISQDGTKKFLYGQITKGASLVIDNKGKDILCEGYATAMSLRRVLRSMGLNYKIHVAFSATNVALLASGIPDCVIVADNDSVGLSSAKKTGKPFWSSPVSGEDFNDLELRVGTEEAGRLFIASGLLGAFD